MKKKLLGTLLAAVMTAAMLAGCGNTGDSSDSADGEKDAKTEDTEKKADASEDAKDEAASDDNTFTVGFDQEFPPMGFVDENGEFTGFDLELAEEVANRLGMKFVPQPISWDAKDMELDSGTIDCIWNGFTMTGREDQYTWSEPYLKNAQVFVVADSSIKTREDLAGKIVEVQADSSAEAALKEDPDLTGTFAQLQTVPDYNTAVMDLQQGAVDAIAMDKVVAAYQIEGRGEELTILDDELQAEEYGIGFKLGNTDLRDKVQSTLEEMASDGKLAEISTKWFGEDITTVGK
ncbi:ABC transporter substrate-binding protein [Lactonifactor longoviformis]|uniref:Polar amino acid transport system substrate-binding protein n=1 Tax=Lactonifactor longoviformis DSM 17459 TaxID=1122155 RepID=A0A1M4U3A0_9CLOT|nr:amino acid ABC transporter substrate-binding protein [Lactonifactor longoviformis]POP34296.1 ABC transporter substrate-binding protein [Lactonifactor longoviformis]SHE51249.1 polar amino acid transport system substrate-binding protein [Lactonifactor longoviformis DSM 17459]